MDYTHFSEKIGGYSPPASYASEVLDMRMQISMK